MKVAIITCYKYPDYGRAVVLRSDLQSIPDVQTIVVKNRHKGILRYPEVMLRTFAMHLRHRPDAYILTFRGYEMLPAILLIALGKPVILDELVNPLEVVTEHRQLYQDSSKGKVMGLWSLFGGVYSLMLRRCKFIIADTVSHAAYSSGASKVPLERYRVIPVGADETIFKSLSPAVTKSSSHTDSFTVLYYGSMVPLHGIKYVLMAAESLKLHANIKFLLIGGGSGAAQQIAEAQKRGAKIEHLSWIEPIDLPEVIANAGLCLGGPFGNTLQSQMITTGKTYQFLACGAPVLIGETEETTGSKLFKDKANCLMVPQANAQAITDAIIWAQTHPKELLQIGQAGHKLYSQNFSQKVINQLLASVLAELA